MGTPRTKSSDTLTSNYGIKMADGFLWKTDATSEISSVSTFGLLNTGLSV